MTMLEQNLKQLATDLELEKAPEKDEKGGYSLLLNPELTVRLRELDPGVYLSAHIGPCPMKRREDLFILLMKANFLGTGTGGSAIGLDEDEKFLTLSLALPYDMNYKMFREVIEDFTNYRDYWREEIIRFETQEILI